MLLFKFYYGWSDENNLDKTFSTDGPLIIVFVSFYPYVMVLWAEIILPWKLFRNGLPRSDLEVGDEAVSNLSVSTQSSAGSQHSTKDAAH